MTGGQRETWKAKGSDRFKKEERSILGRLKEKEVKLKTERNRPPQQTYNFPLWTVRSPSAFALSKWHCYYSRWLAHLRYKVKSIPTVKDQFPSNVFQENIPTTFQSQMVLERLFVYSNINLDIQNHLPRTQRSGLDWAIFPSPQTLCMNNPTFLISSFTKNKISF